jgi:hypothetical protein
MCGGENVDLHSFGKQSSISLTRYLVGETRWKTFDKLKLSVKKGPRGNFFFAVSIIILKIYSDHGPVLADSLCNFASAGCDSLGDVYPLGNWSAVGAADGRASAVVLAQRTVAAEARLVQDGIDLALGIVCVRCMVGVWNGGGAGI